MILKTCGNKLTSKVIKSSLVLLILITFFLVLMFKLNIKHISTLKNNSFLTNGIWLTVGVTKHDNKTDIWVIDSDNQSSEKLVSDRNVMVSGRVNPSGDTLLYSDAIGNGAWDIFKFNRTTDETYQITDDSLGQFNLHFGDSEGNIILSKCGGSSSPIPQISIIDIDKQSANIIELDSDLGVQDFDVYNNKVIALAFSFEEFVNKKFKEGDSLAKITYTIIEMNIDGSNKKVLSQLDAINLDSISFLNCGDSVLLGGSGINDSEKGFYKLDLTQNKLDTLLVEKELQDAGEIEQLSQPFTAALSSDKKNIYFTAIPLDAEEIDILGLSVIPNALYKYNFEKKELTEIFKVKDSFISSLSFTYK